MRDHRQAQNAAFYRPRLSFHTITFPKAGWGGGGEGTKPGRSKGRMYRQPQFASQFVSTVCMRLLAICNLGFGQILDFCMWSGPEPDWLNRNKESSIIGQNVMRKQNLIG